MTDLTKAVAQAYLEMQEAKKKKLDAVDKKELEGEFGDRQDKDLDNDNDVDKSDEYLHNRRKTVKQAMDKDGKQKGKMGMEESVLEERQDTAHHVAKTLRKMGVRHDAKEHEILPKIPHALKKHGLHNNKLIKRDRDFQGDVIDSLRGMKESVQEAKDLNTDNAAKALEHDCATHVQHEQYGIGKCIPGQHTLVAIDETRGYVTHYDVEFEHGIVEDVAVEDLKIIDEMSHGHPRKKKKGMKESFADHAGYEVKGWEVVQENEDGTFDAFINGEFYQGLDEEKAKELKHKNVSQAQPEGQEKLDMKRTKGEEEFVGKSTGGETKDNPETVKQDGTSTQPQSPTRNGDKRANEPMKSVPKAQGQ